MNDIIPAILPKDYEDLKNKIALVRGLAGIVQIDICDGNFVPSKTWPFTHQSRETDPHFNNILNEEEGLPFWEDVEFEIDLMVGDAVTNFDIYAKLGAKRLVFHLEAVEDKNEFRDFLEGIDRYQREMTDIGVAINIETPVEELDKLMSNIDFVQCMGIDKVGFQGQDFDERVLDNIKKIKEKYPNSVVSVDGAVDYDTAPLLLKAGADRLVIGSALFNTDDISETLEHFRSVK